MAITTPDAVPGELITAAWGDAVRADLNTHEIAIAAKVTATGDAMTGNLQVGGDPSAPAAGNVIGATGLIRSTVNTTAINVSLRRWTATAFVVGAKYLNFLDSNTGAEIGSVSIASGTSVAYNTTSDMRTKTAEGEPSDAAARAHQLGSAAFRGRHVDPATGTPEGETWDFLAAADIAAAAPYAVYGEPDAVDGDGHPVWQQVDYGSLVPLLFAALAQTLDRVAALEAAAA